MAKEPIYKISFFNQGKVYEIYAKHVFQSDLWGFLEVEEFVFGERSQMIVDPSEEKLKNEFTGVLTGKGVTWGGSLIRPEATGYGLSLIHI